MTIDMAQTLIGGVGIYLAAGLLFGLIGVLGGLARLDHAARGASIWFRLVTLPGIVVLWPAMLVRALSGRRINAPIAQGEAAE